MSSESARSDPTPCSGNASSSVGCPGARAGASSSDPRYSSASLSISRIAAAISSRSLSGSAIRDTVHRVLTVVVNLGAVRVPVRAAGPTGYLLRTDHHVVDAVLAHEVHG